MGLETGTYISDLVTTNPVGATDFKSEGDNHLRLIKSVLKATFPNADREIVFGGWEKKLAETLTIVDDALFTLGDNGKLIIAVLPSAKTLTLPDPATLNSGEDGISFYLLKDAGPFYLALTPAAGTINALSSLLVGPNEGGLVWSDGSDWFFIGLSQEHTGERTIRRAENDAAEYAGLKLVRARTGSVAVNDMGAAIEAVHKNNADETERRGAIGWQLLNEADGAETIAWYINAMVNGVEDDSTRLWKGAGLFTEGLTDRGAGSINARRICMSSNVVRGCLVNSLSSNTTLTADPSDLARIYVCTGSITIDLPDATLAAPEGGVEFTNRGSGLVTLVRQGTDTIDGLTQRVLRPGDHLFLRSRPIAPGWFTVSGKYSFDSGPQGISSGGLVQVAHGFERPPTQLWARLRNVSGGTVENWADQEEFFCNFANGLDVTTNARHCTVYVDGTNINVRFGSQTNVFVIHNKNTGAAVLGTNTNWNIRIGAEEHY